MNRSIQGTCEKHGLVTMNEHGNSGNFYCEKCDEEWQKRWAHKGGTINLFDILDDPDGALPTPYRLEGEDET